MKALGKLAGLIFLGLLLVIVILGFALTQFFDPNDYKDKIRQIARDKANLELTINGDIGWSLFPWLGLELTETTLASATTPTQPFADLRLLGLSVRVLPLLRKEVQMSDIRIDGLNLTLQRDEQGHGNWQDIGRPAKPASTAVSTSAPADNGAAVPAPASKQPMRLDIDSLSLTNSRIAYRDGKTGQQYSAENIQLNTGAIREGASIPLQFSALLASNQPVLQARTELQGQLRFDRALKRYQLEDLKLSGEVSGEQLQGKTLTFATQGQLLLDQAAQVAEWSGLKLSVNQLRALGELKIRNLDSEPALDGGVSIAALNLREFLPGIGQPLPAMSDSNALTKFELVSRLKGTRNSLKLEELNLKLDDSSFTGSLAVSDFAKQALRAQLKGDQLNLDRYLPPTNKDAANARQAEVNTVLAAAGSAGTSELPKAPTQQAWSEATVLPIERLRSLNAQLGLSLGQLTLHQLPMENFNLKAEGKDGRLNLSELRGELYNGNFSASASLDVQPVTPVLGLQTKISRVAAEQLLKGLGQKPSVSGALDLSADLRSSGNSQKAWVDNLSGPANFAINDGVLFDANLEQQLCQGIATLNRKTLSGEARGKDTAFETLGGNLNIINGVASNPDLKVRIQGLSVNGDGALDLRVLAMDYRVGIIIEGDKSAMPDPACQINQRYVGLEWPLLCRGPLELGAKACRIDKNGLGKIAGKLATEKLGDKIEEKLGDKVSPELKDALKGLFKR
ncbi:MAG: AsmA family protein [Pseudomonas sp.]|uniref:AsmA family protein n=1 Tax=Pseudomonas sp. TaxID=306 RepID=UPI0027367EE5|nr:AsmA family protein [Pseudomonas sp.]MDP3845805.1 AsmA family protein [Pseudomonas sp.]